MITLHILGPPWARAWDILSPLPHLRKPCCCYMLCVSIPAGWRAIYCIALRRISVCKFTLISLRQSDVPGGLSPRTRIPPGTRPQLTAGGLRTEQEPWPSSWVPMVIVAMYGKLQGDRLTKGFTFL